MPGNLLSSETSPYLLQHVQNPVHWHAWNDEALRRANDEDKPIFLSIGYSSCHWCHVMAHESFENDDIAAIMNENFVSIKVDREERPDIDDIYQKACQMATGQGGWPLSAFLTPDQKPFYVGTYFPALDSYGRPGFGSLLRQLSQQWKERRQDIVAAAEKFTSNLQVAAAPERHAIERQMLDEAAVNLYQMGDAVYGGFGGAPKFPNSACISFLLRHAKMSGITRFQKFALKTLDKMARGGIFDQVGGGFHRYSTDARWLVPHFEKMLYDNALIPINYAEAYQITKNPSYLGTMCSTIDFVLRDLGSPQGGFYSAIDADTQDGEGTYYTWTKPEIQEILGEDAGIFCTYYDVTDGGNWEGRTILYNAVSASAIALQESKTEQDVVDTIQRSKDKLLRARMARHGPETDDKILASWNSLMITALARCGRVAQRQDYTDAAERCAHFVLDRMCRGDALFHTYKSSKAKIHGYLDDYAFFASALLDVFSSTADKELLHRASDLAEYMIEHFWSEKDRCFFMTCDEHETLILAPRSSYDLSVPSGSSAAADMLLRIYHLTQNRRFLDVSESVTESSIRQAAENPFAFGHLLNAAYMHLQKPAEITILGDTGSELARFIQEQFIPEGIIIEVSKKEKLDRLSEYDFFAKKPFPSDATAYVCRNFACSPPLRNADEAAKLL